MDYHRFMTAALAEARRALAINDVPIGCVVVYNGQIIGRGYNRRIAQKNTLYHAELIAIDQACAFIGDWRLEGCALFVTVEPCPMCAGAILQARISEVAYGTPNTKAGCAGSVLNLFAHPGFNHQTAVTPNVMADECAALMRAYFAALRRGCGHT